MKSLLITITVVLWFVLIGAFVGTKLPSGDQISRWTEKIEKEPPAVVNR